MAELMRTVARLPEASQNELAAFLLHLRLQHDSAWKLEMARRIDDVSPGKWVDLKDWKKEVQANKRRSSRK